ncbi:8215_t:CDS:2 [Paraglomus brasilianum]|uniref:8215_t:CDS:1 n=1 Tax=Paraglomus brasilianum TaxID=144538 RepID=A0A9N9EGB8_9GLOM|nr:8215_t:CDS:2 [Paraglomus brasilianum]
MDDVLEHWGNIRTSQWSHDAQRHVDEFMDCAHGEGWEDEFFQALRERRSAMEEVQSSVQPEPQPDTNVNSGFMLQFEAAEVQHIIYIESDPSEAGSSDDNDDDDHIDDDQSIRYSSDISDILRNPDKYRVTMPGVPRPMEQNNEEYEYRDRPFSPVGRGSNEEGSGNDGDGID